MSQFFMIFVQCILLLMLHVRIARADILNGFVYPGPNSLLSFFDDRTGDYLYPNRRMVDQFQYASCIDFSAMGKSIKEMPQLRNDTYLNVGTPCDNGFGEGSATIVDSQAHILGAALYSQHCIGYTTTGMMNCNNGSLSLTIFLKNRVSRNFDICVFENWALEFNAAQSTVNDWMLSSVNGYKNWKTAPKVLNFQFKIVDLSRVTRSKLN